MNPTLSLRDATVQDIQLELLRRTGVEKFASTTTARKSTARWVLAESTTDWFQCGGIERVSGTHGFHSTTNSCPLPHWILKIRSESCGGDSARVRRLWSLGF